jgi:hypothetical protein
MSTPATETIASELEAQTTATAAAGTPPPEDHPTEKSVSRGDAIYRLESPARCPQCGEVLSELRAVRLLRVEVNFTSMLPRRGRIVVCPFCQTIVPAELTNL